MKHLPMPVNIMSKKDKLKVNEIFYSIQGEGEYTGIPTIFLRLADCNLNCEWCDTDYSTYKIYDTPEIIKKIEKYNCKNLTITGGEPLLQIDAVNNIVEQLPEYQIFIETNGSLKKTLENKLRVNYTVSPKIDIEGVFEYYHYNPKATFKFIIQNQEDIDRIYNILEKYPYYKKTIYLQPEWGNYKEITKLILRNISDTNFRLSTQTQKFLDLR